MIFTTLTHGANVIPALEKAGKTLDGLVAYCNEYKFEIAKAGNGDSWYHPEAINRFIAF